MLDTPWMDPLWLPKEYFSDYLFHLLSRNKNSSCSLKEKLLFAVLFVTKESCCWLGLLMKIYLFAFLVWQEIRFKLSSSLFLVRRTKSLISIECKHLSIIFRSHEMIKKIKLHKKKLSKFKEKLNSLLQNQEKKLQNLFFYPPTAN